jgi:AraC family transcriptional regulator
MPSFVPVTLGSPRFHAVDFGGFLVTEAWFPARGHLPRHAHDRACLAVMLEGGFDVRFTRTALECAQGAVFTEPAEETHSNRIGEAGAHVLVIQPDVRRLDDLGSRLMLFDRIDSIPESPVAGLAWRLCRELRAADDVAPLAAEGLVLEMLALAARAQSGRDENLTMPRWLRQVHELLHSRFLERLRVAELARAVEVHPVHLARTFRRHFGMKLDWAAHRLASSEEPLAGIALAAGFADQSHFTRAFHRYSGRTPRTYRRAFKARS